MRINTKLIVLTFGLAIMLFAFGCESVIKIDLKNVEPRLVIEGVISDQPEQSWFAISKTTDYFEPNSFPMVSGALVVVSDDNGWADTLNEVQPGIYYSPDLIGQIGRTYYASVTVDSVTYTATSYIPSPITIDSVRTEYQEGGGIGSEENEGYRLYVNFTDPPDIPNYGRLKITVNDSLLPDYFLYDDDFTDGNSIEYNYFDQVFQIGDTLKIDYVSMDSVAYDYFRTLVSVVASENGEDDPIAPANPITNWNNEALGYFGAFSVNTETLIVVENR
jgi:hypothetical protein